VVNFHRGSSAGSKAKTEEMIKGAKWTYPNTSR
jgi:hypothetical protein